MIAIRNVPSQAQPAINTVLALAAQSAEAGLI
jgi:hypothetical protein